ncbi:MAG: hypothetical protein WC551_14130 [Patescibacteria group bacterium]
MGAQVGQTIQASANTIQRYVSEHFRGGQGVDLLLAVDKPLTDIELSSFQSKFMEGGLRLTAPVEYGSHPQYQHVIHMQFAAPTSEGIAALPLAVLLIAAIGAVGIGGVLGWKIGDVISKIGEYILPLALLGGGVFLLTRFVDAKYKKTT